MRLGETGAALLERQRGPRPCASKAVTSESLGFLKQRLAPGNCRICLSFPTSNSVFFNGD